MDNRGNRLIVTDEAAINTPAVAAAYVTKRYASQATDEISLEVCVPLPILSTNLRPVNDDASFCIVTKRPEGINQRKFIEFSKMLSKVICS